MEVVTLSEVTQGLALLQVQGDVEAGLKLVGGGYSGQLDHYEKAMDVLAIALQ
jgi:hypothetical protein